MKNMHSRVGTISCKRKYTDLPHIYALGIDPPPVLNNFPPSHPAQDSNEYMVVVASAKCLRALKREDVFRVPPGTRSPRARLYKNMMPDIPLALSQPCGRFFHEEDFEFSYLRESRCPFSRVTDVGDYGSC